MSERHFTREQLEKWAFRTLAAQAHAARSDPVAFFDFAMLEESTRSRVKCQPHQRVVLSFIDAHDECVLIMPAGTSKTFLLSSYSVFRSGQDNTHRGMFISESLHQAQKPLAFVRDMIAHNPRVRAVFPDLRPSTRESDKWTQSAITIERPIGIRDPTFQAVGAGTRFAGSRLDWIIIDDVLSQLNTSTKEQREKTKHFVFSIAKPRLNPRAGTKFVISNTPWHPEDLAHECWRMGMPTLRMDVYGGIYVYNARPDWDPQWEGRDELRPARPGETNPEAEHRLVAHDPDPDNRTPLWPGRYSFEYIEQKLRPNPNFNPLYLCVCRDNAEARCKVEWVEQCKAKATRLGIFGLVSEYRGGDPAFTGVDLAFSKEARADSTALFTFRVMADGTRVILDIDIGKWDAPTVFGKIVQKQRAYNSIVRVESNAAQVMMRQFLLEKDLSLPVKSHFTTAQGKANPVFGIESTFIEMANGAWAIPCDERGRVHPMVQKWIDACLYYTPDTHVSDVLMAQYMGREQAREWGCLLPFQKDAQRKGRSVGMQITSR